ncbi:MAG: hypothetical protein WC545_03725 [Patescibacteria group bacterium]
MSLFTFKKSKGAHKDNSKEGGKEEHREAARKEDRPVIHKEIRKSSLQNPKILEVNLIKDEAQVFFNWNKNLMALVFVLFLAILFIAEIHFGLSWWEKREIARAEILTESVAEVNREIATARNQAAAALAYKDKSAAFSELLENHVYWTNFFSWLEKNTLSSVEYAGFSGDLTGIYSFGATAQAFADVSWQVKSFLNNPLTLVAAVDSVSAGAEDGENISGVSFNLNLEIKPEIFKK